MAGLSRALAGRASHRLVAGRGPAKVRRTISPWVSLRLVHKTKLSVALGALIAQAMACGTSPPADQPVTLLPSLGPLPSTSATGSLPAASAASVASAQPTSTLNQDLLDVAQVGVLTTDKAAPACPADIKAECSVSDDRCVKPGFKCQCYQEMVPNCGGAAAIPRWAGPRAWHCEPEDRQAKREDGCPFYNPGNVAACTSEGKQCAYGGPCSFQFVTATCTKGLWRLPPATDPPRSPPP